MRIFSAIVSTLTLASALALSGASQASATSAAGVDFGFAIGTFGTFSSNATATTYNPALVPIGSGARVFFFSAPALGSTTALGVHGLLPTRTYGAHAHINACGETGAVAGPHFQHVLDPVTPSVDPAFANPRNEIWLDLTTDRHGRGFAVSTVGWAFGDRRPRSVIIHEMHTHTDPGRAGTAGARLACINVDS